MLNAAILSDYPFSMDKQWPGIIDPNLLWVVLKQLLFLFENHLKGRVATFLWITLTSSSSTTSSEVLILNVINETNSLLIVHNSDGVILKLLSPSRLHSCFLARPPPVVDFLFTFVFLSNKLRFWPIWDGWFVCMFCWRTNMTKPFLHL